VMTTGVVRTHVLVPRPYARPSEPGARPCPNPNPCAHGDRSTSPSHSHGGNSGEEENMHESLDVDGYAMPASLNAFRRAIELRTGKHEPEPGRHVPAAVPPRSSAVHARLLA
jgi:hypothetical protein